MTDWQPIETAPSGWRVVSMRDVDRAPPVWQARRITVPRKGRQEKRTYWIAKDGLICAPTHWLSLPSRGKAGEDE